MPELEPDRERQAIASIRGYAYQCYQTVRAWLQCRPDEELRCEFAEDFDLVRRDLNGQATEAELNQVKHEKKNVTLNSDSIGKLINNFFRHKSRNPKLKLTVRLCAIADRGKENEVDWPNATCGMDLWDQLRGRKLTSQDQATAIDALRSHLKTNIHLSAEVKTFLATSDDSVFLSELIDPIFWDTGQPPYTEMEKEIRQILAARERPISDPLEVDQTINRLWRNVMDLLASDSDRTLTRIDLKNILSQETTVKVDRTLIKQMASDVKNFSQIVTNLITAQISKEIDTSDAIQIRHEQLSFTDQCPPLPAICSPRTEIVKIVRTKSHDKFLLWIYGSTGYGKTILTNLLVRDLNSRFLWFRLRGLIDFELASALRLILKKVGGVSASPRIVVVFDDLSLGDTNTTSAELLVRILETAKNKATEALLIVSSQGFAPSRLTNLLGDHLIAFDMPPMSGDEIRELVTIAGLVDQTLSEFWTRFIEARTKGHPQLVGAYIAYAKDINWTVSAKDIVTTPQTAESVKRESRRLLAESILSPEARELAKRLSVVNLSFLRDFALAVARMAPPLKDPGHAFDSLLGPWIEVIDSDHYCLSPLLEGYAASEVGQSRLTPFYRMAAYAWFFQKQLNQIQFFQFATTALLAKEEFLIAHIGYVLLSMEEEKFQLLARDISLICLFGINGDAFLQDMQPLTRYLFRMGQMRIAAQTDQTTTYKKLDAAILDEFETEEDHEISRIVLFTHYVHTSILRDSPIPTNERIRRAIKAVNYFQKGLIDTEYISPIKAQGRIGQVVMLATSTLASRDDLEYLLEELRQQPADVLSLVFSGFEEFPDMEPLLIDRVWLAESNKDTPQWEECQKLFSKIIDFASKHSRPWLLAGAARAKMVVFDEYLDDPDSAMQIAAEARQKLGETHPLIDLAESTVRYRRGQYDGFLNLFDEVDQSTSPQHLTLERIFALRRAIMERSKTRLWEKIGEYADRGLELADSLPDKIFAGVAVIAFSLERAWADHERGDRVSAVEQFEKALKLAEEFFDQKQPLFHILRLRFGHTLAWLSYSSTENNNARSEQPGTLRRPFCGMFANFEDPPTEALDQLGAPYEGFWAMLAKYAAWYAPRERIQFFALQALRTTPEGQWYLAVRSAWEAQFTSDLANEDFGAALISGLDLITIETIGSNLKEQGKENSIIGYGNFSLELSGDLKSKCADVTPFRVFEPILMTLCSTDPTPQIDFKNWSSILATTFGSHELVLRSLEWLEIGLKAASGDAGATERAKGTAQNLTEQIPAIQRLAQLICCASKTLSLSACLSAQASFLLAIPALFPSTFFAEAFTRMVAKRWMFLAREQRFHIGSPIFYGPLILQATSQKVPTVSECANLLLLVGEALQLNWPQEMRSSLSELSQADKRP